MFFPLLEIVHNTCQQASACFSSGAAMLFLTQSFLTEQFNMADENAEKRKGRNGNSSLEKKRHRSKSYSDDEDKKVTVVVVVLGIHQILQSPLIIIFII